MRTCIACRQTKPKDSMLRIVKRGDTIAVDLTGSAPGRGAYVCDCKDCLAKAVKTRALNRSYRTAVSQDVYDALTERTNR